MLNDRKYNIRMILREVKKRRREGRKALDFINNLSFQDLKSGERVDTILNGRGLHFED